jgi:hypothetical protein
MIIQMDLEGYIIPVKLCKAPKCDNPVTPKKPNKRGPRKTYCSDECKKEIARIYAKKYHTKGPQSTLLLKPKALTKLANGGPVECVICGCPYIEGLTIGHFNGDGKTHRKKIGKHTRDVYRWIIKTPIEEVLLKVQIECIYCNLIHRFTRGSYPALDRRPKW